MAHTRGLNVEVTDPNVWVSQVQGPKALAVLEAAIDDAYPAAFRYFDIATVQIAGQKVIIGRTGFTNELGWEFYPPTDTDRCTIGDKILAAGKTLRHETDIGGSVQNPSN